VQLRDGYRQNRRGQVFYYDENGVLNANGKQDPKPDNNNNNNNNNTSGRNQFVQIGNNVWAYYDGNGRRVTGHQNINGQELFFDNNGVQVKGRTVNENGTIRYYDANSGEMARNRFAEIEPGVWAYFNNDGAAVKGSQNINGQNLLFDNNGKQIKGHLVRVNGVVRYYDPNSGEMAVNRWVEVSPGWWVYFDAQGRGQI